MDVYIMRAQANHYQTFTPAKEEDWGKLDEFDGRRHAFNWVPLRVKVRDSDVGGPLPASDHSNLGGVVPVVSRRAKDRLEAVLAPHGEFLPLLTTVGEYYAFNVTTVLNALDEDASELLRFASGRIMDIVTYRFNPGSLEGAIIFRLAQMARRYVYVTDRFVGLADEHNLTGIDFEHIWSG